MDRYELARFLWCIDEFNEVPEKVVSPNWMREQSLGVYDAAIAERFLALADAIIERLGKGSVAGYQIGSKIYWPGDVTVIRTVPETQAQVSKPSFADKMRSIAEAAQSPVTFDLTSYQSVSMKRFLDKMQAVVEAAELHIMNYSKLVLKTSDADFYMVDLDIQQRYAGEVAVAMFLAEVSRIAYKRRWKGNFRG